MLAGIFTIKEEFVPDAALETQIFEKQTIENTQSANVSPTVFQKYTQVKVIEYNFSGEVVTCINKTNMEQIIDIRLTNLAVENKSVTIYPFNITINLMAGQIKRTDIFFPTGVSTLKFVSNDGEELNVQMPPCINGYEGSTGGFNKQTTSRKVDEIPEFPSVGLPVITIMAMLFILMKKK